MKDLQTIAPQWTPHKSFGLIELGDSIEPYKAPLNLVMNYDREDRYSSEDHNISIDTDGENITCIAVEDECFYKGKNIGIPDFIWTVYDCSCKNYE